MKRAFKHVMTALVSVGLIFASLIFVSLVGPRRSLLSDVVLVDRRSSSGSGQADVRVLLILIVLGLFLILYFVRVFFRASDDFERTYTPRIKRAAGSRLLAVAEFLYSPKTVERVFRPLVADWRGEQHDSLLARRRWKARWINFRYTVSFLMAMGLSKVFSIARSLAGK